MVGKALQTRPRVEITRMPSINLQDNRLALAFGFREEAPQFSETLASAHYYLMKEVVPSGQLQLAPNGYRDVLHGVEWALAHENESDWALLPIEQDPLLSSGQLFIPATVRENLVKAEEAQLFDDFYIAHETAHDPQRGTSALVPWEDLKSTYLRRMSEQVQQSLDESRAAREALAWRSTIRFFDPIVYGVIYSETGDFVSLYEVGRWWTR